MCEDLWKSCVLFGGDLEGCNEEKNGKATERIVSIVKCEETLFEGGLVKILWDSSLVTNL